MCKLFAISSTEKLSRRKLNETLYAVNKIYGATQRDGFGFSIQCGKKRYTERYIEPQSYLGVGALKKTLESVDKFFSKRYEDKYETPDWKLSGFDGPIIVHGRTSTGSVEIKNTHPFTKNDWSLAHNGVVSWSGEKMDMETTCDSEHLLNCYAIGNGTEDFQKLSGWAAWVAINPNGELVAGRDAMTPLHLAYSEYLSAYIIATREEDLEKIISAMGLKHMSILQIPNNSEITFSKSGREVSGNIHKGLSWRTDPSMLALAGKALGCNVKAATTEQIIGRNQPYLKDWINNNPELGEDEEIEEAVKLWEQHNYHNHRTEHSETEWINNETK